MWIWLGFWVGSGWAQDRFLVRVGWFRLPVFGEFRVGGWWFEQD